MVNFDDYLKLLTPKITDELVVSTLATVSRHWHYLKHREGNLYTIYMSGATAFALGLALALPHRRVISLDSDGSLLMGLSVLPVVARQNPPNLIIIVCDNECYGAVDGLPTLTAGSVTCLAGIAREAGIPNTTEAREPSEFQKAIDEAFTAKGTSLIVAKSKLSMPPPPPAPLPYGIENKIQFARHIEATENLQILGPYRARDRR